ncbi:MAG: lipopolysaccharide biosynthesis protein [Magnetococcus sp. WYHC-3]
MVAPASFFHGNLLTLGFQVLIAMKGLVLLPLVVKTLGVSVYGGYTLLMSVLGLLFGVSSLGANVRCQRYLPATYDPHQRRRLFWPPLLFQGLMGLLLGGVFWVVAPLLVPGDTPRLMFSPGAGTAFLVAIILFTSTAWYFRDTGQFLRYNLAAVAHPYLFILVVLLATREGSPQVTAGTLLWMETAVLAILGAGLLWQVLRQIPGLPVGLQPGALLADIRLGFPLVVVFLIDYLLNVGDRYLILLFLDLSQVGVYSAAYAVGMVIMFFPKALAMVLQTLLSRDVDQNRPEHAQQLVQVAVRLFLLVALPFVAGCWVLGDAVLWHFANAQVAAQGHGVLGVIALGALCYGLAAIVDNVLFVRLELRALARATALVAGLNALGNVVLLALVPHILMPALTTLGCYLLLLVYVLRVARRHWPLRLSAVWFLAPLPAVGLMSVALLLARQQWDPLAGWGTLLLLVGLGVGVYALTAWITGVARWQHWQALRRL